MEQTRLERAIEEVGECPREVAGKGIVLCGASDSIVSVWVSIRMLRHLGCELPIELWCYKPESLKQEERWIPLLEKQRVNIRFASEHAESVGRRDLYLPIFGVMHSSFDEVLYLDGAVPVQNVSSLMHSPEFRESGAVFWAGNGSVARENPIWRILDLEPSPGRFDTAQFLVCKSKVWEALAFAGWIAEEGLDETVHPNIRRGVQKDACFLAWTKFGSAYHLPKKAPELLKIPGTRSCRPHAVTQYDFVDYPIFQRRLSPVRPLRGIDFDIPGLLMEATCRSFIDELRTAGIGCISPPENETSPLAEVTAHLLEVGWLLKGWPTFMDNRDELSESQTREKSDPSFAAIEADRGVKGPSKLSERELHFSPDGSFGRWSDASLMYWELKPGGDSVILDLHSEACHVARLELSEDGTWNGRNVQSGREQGRLRLRTFDQAARDVRPLSSRELNVINSSNRLADHIVSLYACAGAASAGRRVRFYTPFHRWFDRVKHPLFETVEEASISSGGEVQSATVDLNHFRGLETRLGLSQTHCYSRLLGETILPERPSAISRVPKERRFEYTNYVLLFPFNVAPSLEWPELHWRRLAVMMKEAGYEVIGVGTSANCERLQDIFEPTCNFWVLDADPDWAMDAMLGAAAVIATANAAAQLAGLFNVPCVALHAQVPPTFLWECTNVRGLVPETKCAPCRWDVGKGYTRLCELGCSALATISPDRVLESFADVVRSNGGEK
jgi:Mannosyltransferase putative